MHKKLLWYLLFSLLFFPNPIRAEEQSVTVWVNGQKILSDVPPRIVQGRTMLPFRAVLNALGVSDDDIYWREESQSVEINSGGVFLFLTVGSHQAVKNEQLLWLEASPFLMEGRTMVPVRLISEALSATVEWSEAEQRVDIVK